MVLCSIVAIVTMHILCIVRDAMFAGIARVRRKDVHETN